MNARYEIFFEDVKNAQKRLDRTVKQLNLMVQHDITKFLTNQLFVPRGKHELYHPVTGMVFNFNVISLGRVTFDVKHESWLGSKVFIWHYKRRTFDDFYNKVLANELVLAHKYKHNRVHFNTKY